MPRPAATGFSAGAFFPPVTMPRISAPFSSHQSARMRTSQPMQKCFTPISRYFAAAAESAQLDARMQALLQRRLDGLALGRHHFGVVRWPGRPMLME